MRRFSRRSWLATIALVIGVAGPLGFGWWTGRSAALAEADALRKAPRIAAREAGERIAVKVLDRLDAMVAKESERPYFHYQNYFVDPRGAYAGTAVVPSPLADGNRGAVDPLVAAYFQVDQDGKVTMPNVPEGVDDAPAPNAMDVAMLAELRHADIPRPPASTALALAWLAEPKPEPEPEPIQIANNDVQAEVVQMPEDEMKGSKRVMQQKGVQEVVIDAEQYKQNLEANQLFNEINKKNPKANTNKAKPRILTKDGKAPIEEPKDEEELDPNQQVQQPQKVEEPPPQNQQPQPQMPMQQEVQQPRRPTKGAPQQQQQQPLDLQAQQQQQLPAASEPEEGVVVRMGPFEWETLMIGGRPTLAALRHIIAPEGVRSQGFVIAHDALEELAKDGETQGLLMPADSKNGKPGVEVSLTGTNWRVLVPSAQAEAEADAQADQLVGDFHMRFAGMGVLALLALAAVIVALVLADRNIERRQRFAAAAAHELRTPLAGLRMYAEMIALGLGKPEKQKVYAERLATEAGRLGRVVANVLDFTRMERGNLSVKPAVGDLAAAVDEQVSRLEPAIRAAGASLTFERDAGDPMPALFDADALAQILANLVDNAEKYGRESADRSIVVSLERGAKGPEVHVKDRGPGLRPGFESRLFRPFARGNDKDGPAGLGLGLALTRALAVAQKGDIQFARRVGGGAEFIVRLSPG